MTNAISVHRPIRRRIPIGIVVVASLCAASCAQASKATVHVPNNVALRALPSTAREAVRDSFDRAGDAPPQLYSASDHACRLNAGQGDGGFEVRSADGKCWLIEQQASYDIRQWGASPAKSAASNSAALERIFADSGSRQFTIPAGVFNIACRSRLRAASSISLLGAGAGRSVLRLERQCPALDHAIMEWTSKSDVRISGWTLDLNDSRFAKLNNVMQFQAYAGDAHGLRIDHFEIANGNTLSLLIGVAAAGGFTYSGVVIDNNRLQMRPGRSQNQCIALSTVNGLGYIPEARITNNVCIGSAIQGDGVGTVIAGNDVSGYSFGQGIFTAYVSTRKIVGGGWSRNVATLTLAGRDNPYSPGQTIHVQGVTPLAFNGSFPVLRATSGSVSFVLPRDPGAFRSGGLVAPTISNRDCIIKDNLLHDTAQSIDVNRTPPGGLENNCLGSLVSGNRAVNLGGPGFLNFASSARYIGNETVNVGFSGKNSAVGDADGAAFIAFDNGSGLSGYTSSTLYFERNTVTDSSGRTRFGYYEEPYHKFSTRFRDNRFSGSVAPMIVRERN